MSVNEIRLRGRLEWWPRHKEGSSHGNSGAGEVKGKKEFE